MKLLIVGSSDVAPLDISRYIGEQYDEIIVPSGTEICKFAEQYADALQISKHVIYPKYHLYNKEQAIKQRNVEMIELCDGVLVLCDEKTDDAEEIVIRAGEMGKKIELIYSNNIG